MKIVITVTVVKVLIFVIVVTAMTMLTLVTNVTVMTVVTLLMEVSVVTGLPSAPLFPTCIDVILKVFFNKGRVSWKN